MCKRCSRVGSAPNHRLSSAQRRVQIHNIERSAPYDKTDSLSKWKDNSDLSGIYEPLEQPTVLAVNVGVPRSSAPTSPLQQRHRSAHVHDGATATAAAASDSNSNGRSGCARVETAALYSYCPYGRCVVGRLSWKAFVSPGGVHVVDRASGSV